MDNDIDHGRNDPHKPIQPGQQASERNAEASAYNVDEHGSSPTDPKPLGVETDQVAQAAKDGAGELQRMIIDEIRARPMQTLGWAAAAGAVLGIWAAR